MRRTRTLAAGCALALAAAPLTAAATAVSASAFHLGVEVEPARIAGENRYATAAEIARFLYPDGVSEAVLGSGTDFPDALAGAPLASANSSPVLLTDPSQLSAATADALEGLGVNQVTLLGGPEAISPDVAQELESRGYVVGRVAGANRYETAAELARAVYAENDGPNFPGGVQTPQDVRRAVFVANGQSFPDALAASAPASAGPAQIPILLTEDDQLPAATAQVLQELNVDTAVLVGGTAAISESVRQAIEDLGINTPRVGGQTRTETATEVAGFADKTLGFDDTSQLLARGDAFPDALAAGPLGGARQDPILLTQDPNTLSSATSSYLAAQCPDLEVIRAVGGEQAVTPATLAQAEQAAENCTPPVGIGVDVAAVDAAGRTVILDSHTGEVRRVLVEGIDVSDPADNAIAVTPNRSTVFVVRPGAAQQDSQILQVDAAGGEPEVLAQGTAPAVNSNNSTLAYVQFVDTGQALPAPTIRLRDLATGSERAIGGGQFYGIRELAWTEDNNRIAFTAGENKTGVHIIERDATSLAAATRLGPDNPDASWGDVVSLGGNRLAVVERCCDLPNPEPEQWRVIEVDAATGEVVGEIFGRERTEATLVDDRFDGQGLLVVQGGGPDGSPLLRWDGSGELQQIATDVIVAAW